MNKYDPAKIEKKWPSSAEATDGKQKYNFHDIESKWQRAWSQKKDLFHGEDFSSKPKHYHLVEFPYPSGAGLHVGHCMGYGASDAYSRMKRMQGFNVMFPMGWDAFGLPTENFAIKTGQKPAKVTKENSDTFRRQMKEMGLSFDWDREINTTDPSYFRWTQWIFLQFYTHAVVDGKLVEVKDDDTITPRLAYQSEMPINWCPSCKIGLANEEVIAGKCERCESEVIKKMQKQWMLRITAYADRLIKDLNTVDYLDKIKTQQINWIGKSTGTNINFPIKKQDETVLLIDGLGGDGTSNWLPWLKQSLENFGYKVLSHALPNFDKPDYSETIAFLKDLLKDFKGSLSVVAHSLGAVTACSVISELNIKVDKLILVSPADTKTDILNRITEHFGADAIQAVEKYISSAKIDWKKVNESVSHSYLYFSDNDPYIPEEIKEQWKGLEAKTRNFHKKGHFDKKAGVTQLPEIFIDLFDSLEVFTTRADTLFGCTYVVLAPEHPLLDNLKFKIQNLKEVEEYIEKSKKKSDMERTELAKEKTGVKLDGIKAINPINNEEVDVYVADYVLANYGTGAVMAVPAHDERDWEFAKKFNIPIKDVIVPREGEPHEGSEYRRTVSAVIQRKSDGKFLLIKWKKFGWISPIAGGIDEGEEPEDAIVREVLEETGYKVKPIQRLGGIVESHFYAENKKVWRHRHDQHILCELVDENSSPADNIEKDDYETVWLTAEEALKKITHPYNGLGIERLLKGNFSFTDYGHLVNSSEYDGLSSEDAKKKITEKLKEIGSGDFTVNYKLRDWIFSRQHYWGEPIPIIHCMKCGIVPLKEDNLPLTLPDVENYQPTNTGESPLADISEWVKVKCPKCGGEAKRETDTMPNWAGSSWYYLAYAMNVNTEKNAFKENDKELKYWMPVDLYNGGMEHTTLHLLYSRFWNKFLFDLNVAPTSEPYQKRIAHGIILGADGRKMSKSFGNVINPDDIVKQYGADTTRAYIMFIGPYDSESAWNMAGVAGVSRFLNRIYNNFSRTRSEFVDSKELLLKLNQSIAGITEDLENFRLNTVVSKLMELNNAIEKSEGISKESYEKFIKLLFPVAPHLSSELWEMIGNSDVIDFTSWPNVDEKYLVADQIEIVVQVNGKVRDRLMVDPNISEDELKELVLNSQKTIQNIDGKEIVKTIVVPRKLVSIVTKH